MKETTIIIHNAIASFLSAKPQVGILTSFAGLGAAILSWLHILTIVLGFAGAVIGLIAGIYTFLIKRKEWKDLNKQLRN